MAVLQRACVSAEFRAFANKKGPNQSSPVTLRLRALARLAHTEFGGPGASPHSVVTAHLIDEAGQPTIAARDEILAFFRRRLVA